VPYRSPAATGARLPQPDASNRLQFGLRPRIEVSI